MQDWTPDSWTAKPALQQPTYADPQKVERVMTELFVGPSAASYPFERPCTETEL